MTEVKAAHDRHPSSSSPRSRRTSGPVFDHHPFEKVAEQVATTVRLAQSISVGCPSASGTRASAAKSSRSWSRRLAPRHRHVSRPTGRSDSQEIFEMRRRSSTVSNASSSKTPPSIWTATSNSPSDRSPRNSVAWKSARQFVNGDGVDRSRTAFSRTTEIEHPGHCRLVKTLAADDLIDLYHSLNSAFYAANAAVR